MGISISGVEARLKCFLVRPYDMSGLVAAKNDTKKLLQLYLTLWLPPLNYPPRNNGLIRPY